MKKPSTQEILLDTIKELLTLKSPSQITVKDILEVSGISRPTFYKYFLDKQDLIEYVFKKELCEPYFMDYTRDLQAREILFLSHLAKHRSFYIHALETVGQNSFYSMWLDQAVTSLYGFFRANQEYSSINDAYLMFASKYLAYAWVNMNIDWLKNPQNMMPEDMASMLNTMMNIGLDGFKKTN